MGSWIKAKDYPVNGELHGTHKQFVFKKQQNNFCKINDETSAFEELDCTAETNESISGDMPKDEFENWVDIDKDVKVVATMTLSEICKEVLMMAPNYQKRVSVTYIQKKKFQNLL